MLSLVIWKKKNEAYTEKGRKEIEMKGRKIKFERKEGGCKFLYKQLKVLHTKTFGRDK